MLTWGQLLGSGKGGEDASPISQTLNIEKEECSPGDSCLAVERAGKVRALSSKP